ncbi:hypothetical protein C7U63_00020 [Aeromonas veronii]|uniref:hypothetical protein n=1 Tax=Aeromonas veronii TaxID=654 RepID=UPI000E57ED0B|nr:hypothetical protein [Aeromonas veronii]AXV18558.1 hypothetical protein C7U63_00020 [Aeromonas veronii]
METKLLVAAIAADNEVICASVAAGNRIIVSRNGNQAAGWQRLSADNEVICASVAAGNRIIGIEKWKPSCWLAAIAS